MSEAGTVLRHKRRAEPGWVLIEVLVALLLCGILVGGLADCLFSAARLVDRLQIKAPALDGPEPGDEGAWGWGPRIVRAGWISGPALNVDVAAPADGGPVVGVWCNGWQKVQQQLGSSGTIQFDSATWSRWQGAEVTVRVRQADGDWGPPWRTIVPGPSGQIADAENESATGTAVIRAVVHGLSDAAPELQLAGTDQGEADVAGFPCRVIGSNDGLHQTGFAGSIQHWMGAAGRELDVYF